MQTSRRKFLKQSVVAGAALSIHPFPIFAEGSPNEKVVVAVMGVRSRGLQLAKTFAQLSGTEVAVICDVDQRYLDKGIAEVAALQKRKPAGEKDLRKVLENKDIDALVVAAPDHWHAPAAILAVKAGKHVYLEKPCSHNPREGELLIEAQKKYRRIIHMGNQRRSWPNCVAAINELRGGTIGKVYFAKGWYANGRKPIGFGKQVPVPDYLDFDLWQGPAPRTTYRDNIHPYNWHWFWRWGTGEALNNGTHEIDMMRWGMGVDFPSRVVASGGRYHYHDDWEFPDTMVATFDFDDGRTITWESRSSNPFHVHGDSRGTIFYGEKGTLIQTQHDYFVYDLNNELLKQEKHAASADFDATNTVSPFEALEPLHIQNFLDAVREGLPSNSPIDEGHKSVLMCQLANIAWKTGRALHINQSNGHVVGDREAMTYWSREYEPGWEPVV